MQPLALYKQLIRRLQRASRLARLQDSRALGIPKTGAHEYERERTVGKALDHLEPLTKDYGNAKSKAFHGASRSKMLPQA